MIKKRNSTKISIIGAGAVGATTAYSLMLLGVATELVLVDVNKEKTEGEAMDLSHGADFVKPVNIISGDYKDTKGSDIVVITAGAAQKPGETRLQLVNKNISIFKSIIPEVVKYNEDAILLVVTNPVDILSYLTYKLSGFPKERIIGSGTVLDTSRLKHEIGKRYNIDPRNVNTYIIGEHGDSEIATWNVTNIQNIKIDEYANKENLEYNDNFRKEVYENVKNAAYEVINRKGATFYAIALAVTRIVKAILGDEKTILPVSTLVENYYGIKDVYLGLPCVVGGAGVEKVLNMDLSELEADSLVRSAETLKETLNNASGL
ncbi:L-lactate dehydrogenase [Clostridium argentinense CDC 2741]|uniref:L-lactate dehydrogenase n=1 Tax=Clostridium argentinense CDC 2741 TaxID=1418104 RepID=A0A0C1R3G5_9CLOT|nr:L-lactate dehydrogenase [Clostridium argentinense]ARC84295.1 L-lactate dehydrogenase [Clostridium argentinense]KIE44996.1 L-lactate dehydrogenase [Clostridium argentinense CDC 2741]NFF38256.1 L-lactate dehydrogenase [Clostridium argentinense]NFP49159.1 L-lactate dehydrogenase [Clostridium argentinense]NFP71561.1 L-lactate dehydrogenase [Clostridium argentinense]